MRIDVDKHVEDLSSVETIRLREHIGSAYSLAESLDWCDPSEHFDIHKRTMSSKTGNKPKEAIVPVISADFEKHESAREAYTELQHATEDIEIEVYDVHYERQDKSIGIVLNPFEI